MKNILKDISVIRIGLVFLFNTFLINGFAQHFIFEVSPGLKFYGTSFQKINGEVLNGGNNAYSYNKINTVGSYEDISHTNKLSLEPELNIAFLKINNNWKIGLGLSTFIVKSKIRATTTGYSYLSYVDGSTLFTEYISKQLINRYNQFSIFGTRTFHTQTRLDNVIVNSLTVGFGLNEPSRFNTRNEKEYNESYLYDHYGYVKEITFKKSSFFGFLKPVLILKYEMEFQNRKNDYGLIKLNFSYIQGFSNQTTFNLISSSIGGANMNVESINRGSGFRIGLSKSFRFEKKKI